MLKIVLTGGGIKALLGAGDSIVSRIFALHETDPGSVLTLYCSSSLLGMTPECRIRNKPLALPGVTQQTKKKIHTNPYLYHIIIHSSQNRKNPDSSC